MLLLELAVVEAGEDALRPRAQAVIIGFPACIELQVHHVETAVDDPAKTD